MMPSPSRILAGLVATVLLALALFPSPAAAQQPQVNLVITTAKKLRLAVPDFKIPAGAAAASTTLQQTFDGVLWNDLNQSGLVEMISKSFYPLQQPGSPADLGGANLGAWSAAPTAAQRLVFGNIVVGNGTLQVEGYLYDVTQPAKPFVLGKRYTDQPTPAAARVMAHEFADAIIAALGGGAGIAQSKIVFISERTGHKEVWIMDYDGANQQQLTHLNSICYSPRLSPDGTKLAFMTFAGGTPQIRILNLLTHRYEHFPHFAGTNSTPAWSPDGTKLAFASSRTGDMEIYTINANGTGLHRLTYSRGVDIAPVWNPKTGAQIAFESDRTGLPQIYMMDADGTNQQRLTMSGYAVSPSWSPNGEMLAFSWRRTGGGEGNGGAYDVYLWTLADRNYLQLTHNGERNDFPSWAPDGRHIVFASGDGSHWQLFTILADGTNPAKITVGGGSNTMPNWSWH